VPNKRNDTALRFVYSKYFNSYSPLQWRHDRLPSLIIYLNLWNPTLLYTLEDRKQHPFRAERPFIDHYAENAPPPPRGIKKHKFCRASGKDCFCSQLAYCQCLSVGAHPKGLCNLKTLTRWLEHYIRLSLKILFFQRIHFSFLTTYPLSKRVNQNKFSTHPETLAWASETTWIENATRCKPTW